MKKSSYSFNMVKLLKVNEHLCLIGMPDAGLRINDNIDPNWANEVCKWSVTITICSFSHFGQSKELNYIRKISTWGDKGFRSCTIILSQSVLPIQLIELLILDQFLTNKVSKLLRLNFLPYTVFTFEQWLIVLILYVDKNKLRYFFDVFST